MTDFQIRASESVGSSVEPHSRYRFEATVQLQEDTFRESGQLAEALLLQKVLDKGSQRRLYGVADATLRGGQWVITYQLDSDPLRDVGELRSAFGSRRTVIRGSLEQSQFQAELDQRRIVEERAEQQRLAQQHEMILALLHTKPVLECAPAESYNNEQTTIRIQSVGADAQEVSGVVERQFHGAMSGYGTEIARFKGKLVGAQLNLQEYAATQVYSASVFHPRSYSFRAVDANTVDDKNSDTARSCRRKSP